MKYINILAYGPGYGAEPTAVPDDLGTMQQIVGGLVEVFDFTVDGTTVQVIVNEDAEARGLPRNRRVGDRMVYGHLVVTRCAIDAAGRWKFKTLSQKDLMKVWKRIDADNQSA